MASTDPTQTSAPAGRRKKKRKIAGLRAAGQSSMLSLVGEDRYLESRERAHMLLNELRQKEVLVIHQMGKVGSTTITASLRSAGVREDTAIYQTHFLSADGRDMVRGWEIEAHGDWDVLPRKVRWMHIRNDLLYDKLRKMRESGKRCKVISLVRDPIAINLSGFFQQNRWWPDDLKALCNDGPSTECLDALRDRFTEWYPHDTPLTWFDMEMEPVFGIDIYATPFPKAQGYQIIHGDFADLLLIKLEKLNECGDVAMGEFLGREPLPLVQANTAEDKWYSPLYAAFKQSAGLPTDYLDHMYTSRHATHFYTADELQAFRRRWMNT